MNTKNNRNGKRISGLIAMIALLAAMSGCTFNAPQPTANQMPNTPAPANIPAPANTSASNSSSNSTAENPAEAFYGKWEVKQGQAFQFATFGQASKQGDNYVGKLTGQRSEAIATYTVFNNKTVEIAYLPAFNNGEHYTYPYEFSDGGKKLTLDADPPIVYTKGTTNTNIEKDVNLLLGGNLWISSKDKAKGLMFTGGQQEDKGWSGRYQFTDNGNSNGGGTFEITEAGKMTLKPLIGGSSTAYTYKFRGNLFDFTRDRDGDTDTYAPF